MNKQTEALRMAKQHIIERKGGRGGAVCYVKSDEDVIKAIDEALEQPAQEPVAWIKEVELGYMKSNIAISKMDYRTNLGLKPELGDVPLYTHPAPSWQGLSDDEVDDIWFEVVKENNFEGTGKYFWRAIERALKEKNNG